MSEYPILIFMALMVLGYGFFSKVSEKSIISGPMVFVIVGLLIHFFIGEKWKEGITAHWLEPIAMVTLALVLFIDASTINLKSLMKDRGLPTRLLLIGLPLTMVLGVVLAIPLFRDIGIWQLTLMPLILSPTDAGVGVAVVTTKIVPEKIRQTINVESGLNDGIALPPILVCIAMLSGELPADGTGVSALLFFTGKQFVFGPLAGGVVGWVGGYLVDQASQREWMNQTFQRLSAIAIALLAFSVAELLDGNGFIAAFFAGLFLGAQTLKIRERIHEFGEAESQALILFVFLLLGMIMVPLCYPYWDWQTIVYSVLSLTIIRMVPVALSLLGTKLEWGTIAFIGWFGPRGIASVLYLLIVVIELGTVGYEKILSIITLTILMSIFLHGVTAIPFSGYFEKRDDKI